MAIGITGLDEMDQELLGCGPDGCDEDGNYVLGKEDETRRVSERDKEKTTYIVETIRTKGVNRHFEKIEFDNEAYARLCIALINKSNSTTAEFIKEN